jgi:hypothetical protein
MNRAPAKFQIGLLTVSNRHKETLDERFVVPLLVRVVISKSLDSLNQILKDPGCSTVPLLMLSFHSLL